MTNETDADSELVFASHSGLFPTQLQKGRSTQVGPGPQQWTQFEAPNMLIQ